jgi:O-glycosyl hydrolase
MSVFCSFREAPRRRAIEVALFFIFLAAILITNGCAGVVSGNGGPGNQPTPQGAVTISSVQATAPTSSGFQVGWLTNVPANSQIDYGTSAAYGSSTPLNITTVTVHQVVLSGLATGTLYHYRVRSIDARNNQAVSTDFTFATAGDTTPPTVSITSPAAGATLTSTVNVVASAQDNVSVASVQFKVDGANSGPSFTAPPYSYSLNTTSLSNGNHTLAATATDGAGNTASSATVPIVVNNSSASQLVVSITAPVSGATVSGTTTVTANASSSIGVASVQFQLDGANVGSPVTVAPYTYSWDTTKSSNGSHTLKAVAKDTAGTSTTSAADTVTVSNAVASPVVSITAPASGATVSGTVTVTANATSSVGVASVQFQLDGANVGNPLTAAPYSYSWDTGKSPNGSHTLKAVAKDTAGTSTTSAGDTVTVNNAVAAPVVSITAPASGATVSGTTTVTASATSSIGVASVQFQLDGANAGSPVTAAPYIYSWDTAKSTNGSHTLKAIAKDTVGNSTTSAGDTVTVNNAVAPPVVSITAPANGATVSGTATVTATATSSIGVASVQFQLDGTNVGSPVTAAPYSYSWDTTKSSNGSHTLKAIAKDTVGNSTTSAGDTVTVSNAVAPPVVSITAPANGATVSGAITVSGSASSSLSISSVQVSVDSGSFSNASGTNSWSFSLDTASLSNATHTLTAKATDSAGGTASSSVVSITVNNAAGPTVTVNWSDVHQQIDGFGAASVSTGDGITDSQADLFWSTTSGVGLSLLRVQIQTDGTYPDLATMQKAQDRGVRIWGTPWSPAASMKSNGSTNNGGSLLAADYQAYADYLSGYVLGLKNSYGISLYALSIQNEPDYTASWQSCIWTGQQFHDFLGNNLLPTFAKNGVTTKIIMPEESGWKFDLATATLNDPVTAAGVSIIAGHNYDGASAAPYPLGQNQGKGLWETEVSSFETFDASMTNGLKWAQKINDWMTIANANAWHYWWLIDGNSDNEALLGPSGQTTKRLFVMGNYSKFVRPGYYRIGTSASPVGGVSISAYKDPSTGKFAIVAINQNASAVTLDFALNGFTANAVAPWVTSASLDLVQQPSITVGGSAFVATLSAASVTTFVGP